MTEEDARNFKLIFLGDQFVGKSSILNRFYQDKFDSEYQATIGLDFHSKNVNINGNVIRISLYDTAGQEKFKSLIPMYVRDSQIILVVYDITNKESFIHTEFWVNETKDLKSDDAIFVLVGNKIDLNDNRAISTKEAEEFANQKGYLFYEVSAKTGEQIQELFTNKIYPEMAKKFRIGDQEDNENNEQKPGNENKGTKLNTEEREKKKKGGCCGGKKKELQALPQNQEDNVENAEDGTKEEEQTNDNE
jgi:Ras-related protein Rab-6A